MEHHIQIGINHILDIEALDHLYFIVSFCLLYTLKNIKKIAALVTAFTIGHCITLALAALDMVTVNPDFIEILIPITILITCLINYWSLLNNKSKSSLNGYLIYFIILFFGLIHGLGFSNFLSAMLFEGQSIITPLLGFNIGIEIAQLIIVFIVLSLLWSSDKFVKSGEIIRLVLNTIITLLVLKMIFI